ncbi:fimbrillin family protein [Segatella paludivivens]|uniref:fimbrillin family protein n=1 Tax=Segatella paludivivens TaxID=185294 RepID=UPI0003A8A9EC|nr:fimbrillin family protein [Segatella paludivivens]
MGKKFLRGINVSFLLFIISTFCSCANEMNIFEEKNNKQINFSVSVPEWKNTDSLATTKTSRAMPIGGSSLSTSNTFNLLADQNDGAGNYSTLINSQAVSYTNNIWKTSKDYYWPGTANKTINFYAYYPSTISNVSHTAGSSPTLSYTVPDNVSDQIDIMTATNNNVNGNTNSSISLTFKHIFSSVQFNIGSSGMPNGTITGISLNNILCKGTYNFNETWTQDATTKKSFSQTVSSSTTAGTTITSGATTFMMMPQTLGSDASITVTYSNGGTLTQSITGTWTAGNIYSYNISKTIPVANFAYTGSVQTYTVPVTGTYKLEVWGAQGGQGTQTTSGKGGYSCGTVSLIKNKVLYVCIGGQGCLPTYSSDYSYGVSGKSIGGTGGYNGGGQGGDGFTAYSGGGGGGGATHIATSNGLLKELSSNQSSVLIVAGGGGCSWVSGSVADGGGQIGLSASFATYTSVGGSQTSGYQFGQGQNGSSKIGVWNCGAEGNGGAGGGWYGGYAYQIENGENTNVGGGGGSGHIGSGVTGSTIAGNTSFTDYDGTTVTGHAGNGYARITFVSAN